MDFGHGSDSQEREDQLQLIKDNVKKVNDSLQTLSLASQRAVRRFTTKRRPERHSQTRLLLPYSIQKEDEEDEVRLTHPNSSSKPAGGARCGEAATVFELFRWAMLDIS